MSKYIKVTKMAELFRKINELEKLNDEVNKKAEAYENLDFKWAGNLGRWSWNYITNEVSFNPLKASALGYEENDLPETVGFEFFTDKLHPEDYTNTMNVMRNVLMGLSEIYEVEYRIQAKDGSWKWYYDRGAITERDKDGKPVIISGIVFDISHQKNIEKQLLEQNMVLEKLAYIDGLTDLFNHKTIYEKLDYEVKRSKRYDKKLAVAMFDIDDFKKVNDTFGHVVGDDVITMVANKIRECIRSIDRAGRYGGEEFIIIFPETSLNEAYKVAERIRITVSEAVFENDIHVTVSGGVAEFHGQTEYELVDEADIRLLLAKRRGKNQIVIE